MKARIKAEVKTEFRSRSPDVVCNRQSVLLPMQPSLRKNQEELPEGMHKIRVINV
jgi:hypothetical protein